MSQSLRSPNFFFVFIEFFLNITLETHFFKNSVVFGQMVEKGEKAAKDYVILSSLSSLILKRFDGIYAASIIYIGIWQRNIT